jgi:hypothetical protein
MNKNSVGPRVLFGSLAALSAFSAATVLTGGHSPSEKPVRRPAQPALSTPTPTSSVKPRAYAATCDESTKLDQRDIAYRDSGWVIRGTSSKVETRYYVDGVPYIPKSCPGYNL